MLRKIALMGCLAGASLFYACQQSPSSSSQQEQEADSSSSSSSAKEMEMYQASELAQLMRKMYEDNLALRDTILQGEVPQSFPRDFERIHTAAATDDENQEATFKALAQEYLRHYDSLQEASNPAAARISYNGMIQTCASCHQQYCRGPLAKINRMRIKEKDL